MRALTFLRTLSPQELMRYHQVVSRSELVRSHRELLVWLQGDMQQFLPHEIMIAAWGDFSSGAVKYEVISAIAGVQSHASNPATLIPLLTGLFSRWANLGKSPLAIKAGAGGFVLEDTGLACALGSALQTMSSALVHCICDERGSHDCLYVTFSSHKRADAAMRGAMLMVLPFIDLALRQIEHTPHPNTSLQAEPVAAQLLEQHDLSEREVQVLHWVAQGKTNVEIGAILNISGFTVKNHMQRMFKKLSVSNRAQAVAKFNSLFSHV
jgi:transcriptional regulator EpsA